LEAGIASNQTVFYLHKKLIAYENETIQGTFTLKPHPHNHRDLHISIAYEHQGKNEATSATHEYNMR
jgi:hypothetical protein